MKGISESVGNSKSQLVILSDSEVQSAVAQLAQPPVSHAPLVAALFIVPLLVWLPLGSIELEEGGKVEPSSRKHSNRMFQIRSRQTLRITSNAVRLRVSFGSWSLEYSKPNASKRSSIRWTKSFANLAALQRRVDRWTFSGFPCHIRFQVFEFVWSSCVYASMYHIQRAIHSTF